MNRLATIGYERATVASFLEALRGAEIDFLVDVRAVARSRRPGFAKTALAANLAGAEIDYLHLRGLGTPVEGRVAAKGGDVATMRAIFREHLDSPEALDDLDALERLVLSGKRVCILCYEAPAARCHRSLVADALAARIPLTIEHLDPTDD